MNISRIHRLPWNQATLLGFISEVFFTFLLFESYLTINITVMLLFISIVLNHRAFYKMFRHSFRQMDHPDKKRNVKQELCKQIQFHNSVKGWAITLIYPIQFEKSEENLIWNCWRKFNWFSSVFPHFYQMVHTVSQCLQSFCIGYIDFYNDDACFHRLSTGFGNKISLFSIVTGP